MLLFRENGPELFADMLDQFMHTPEGLKTWYLRVIDRLAKTGAVKVASIEGKAWGEVDFLEDLERARQMVTSCLATSRHRMRRSKWYERIRSCILKKCSILILKTISGSCIK